MPRAGANKLSHSLGAAGRWCGAGSAQCFEWCTLDQRSAISGREWGGIGTVSLDMSHHSIDQVSEFAIDDSKIPECTSGWAKGELWRRSRRGWTDEHSHISELVIRIGIFVQQRAHTVPGSGDLPAWSNPAHSLERPDHEQRAEQCWSKRERKGSQIIDYWTGIHRYHIKESRPVR